MSTLDRYKFQAWSFAYDYYLGTQGSLSVMLWLLLRNTSFGIIFSRNLSLLYGFYGICNGVRYPHSQTQYWLQLLSICDFTPAHTARYATRRDATLLDFFNLYILGQHCCIIGVRVYRAFVWENDGLGQICGLQPSKRRFEEVEEVGQEGVNRKA